MTKSNGRWHEATWRGPVPNMYKAGMLANKGLVLHIQQGYESGTDSCFRNPSFKASAHFGVGGNRHKDEHNDGHVDQWVSVNDAAWAEVSGNRYWTSVEIEGFSGQPATDAQIESLAKLYAWGHRQFGWPLQVANEPGGAGLGYHAMGGSAWGDHLQCPGHVIVAQRPRILHRVEDLLNFVPPPDPNHGKPKHEEKPVVGWYHRLLKVEDPMLHGSDVERVQRAVSATEDGWYGPETESRVRGFQRSKRIKADGVVGPKTAAKIGE